MTRAIVVTASGPSLTDIDIAPPGPGEALVEVVASSLNYKDGLALAGNPGVKRLEPLVPGIDVVGTIAELGPASGSVADGVQPGVTPFRVGDRVTLNGAGLGETRHGGYATHAVVPLESLVLLSEAISDERAAAIGTAGFTAMLSLLALERNVDPGDGPVLVTGSSGGVGTVAIALLAHAGYEVVASTGRATNAPTLRALGAAEVIDRSEFETPGKPMQRARWAGAIDSVGGPTLANILAQTKWGGTVTACGLAQDSHLDMTVMPFILRAVSLVGINSVDAPIALRQRAWDRLATDLDLALLDSVTRRVGLSEVIDLGPEVLAGRVRGRTVVDIAH